MLTQELKVQNGSNMLLCSELKTSQSIPHLEVNGPMLTRIGSAVFRRSSATDYCCGFVAATYASPVFLARILETRQCSHAQYRRDRPERCGLAFMGYLVT